MPYSPLQRKVARHPRLVERRFALGGAILCAAVGGLGLALDRFASIANPFDALLVVAVLYLLMALQRAIPGRSGSAPATADIGH